MSRSPRNPVRDLRAAARLVVTGGTAATGVVEQMHSTIAAGPLRRPSGPGLISSLVYRGIRDITRVTGTGVDRVLASVEKLVGDTAPGATRAALIAALNGVVGDHLAETGNPLAIEMRLCRDGRTLDLDALPAAIPEPTGKILVLVHGLCTDDRFWLRNGHDYGEALVRDLGYTAVYLHYNTGLHIWDNGRQLSALLERLVGSWPVPVEEIALMGHSMGGLVARSACHDAESTASVARHGDAQPTPSTWRATLTRLVCLGSPHHGAPMERGGNWLQIVLGVSRYSAPIGTMGRLRSAGITDLRYGSIRAHPASAPDRFAHTGDSREPTELPRGVACYAVAATLSPAGKSRPRGDGLVPVASALGHHADPRLDLGFPAAHQHVVTETGHLDLVGDDEVYRTLRNWLSAAP